MKLLRTFIIPRFYKMVLLLLRPTMYIGIFPSQGFLIRTASQKPLTWEDAYIDEELCVKFNYISEEKVYLYMVIQYLHC